MPNMDWTPEQAKKAHEEMLRGSQVPSSMLLNDIAKLTSERDALLSALEEIVVEAFDCDIEGEQYCTHDCVQNMVVSLLVTHGRMVKSETNGCPWYSFNARPHGEPIGDTVRDVVGTEKL